MYKKNLIIIALLATSANLFSQSTVRSVRFIYVDPTSNVFAIKNYLDADSNLGEWRVASSGVDTPLSKLNVVLGTLNKCPNLQSVVFQGLPMNKVKGSLTMYLPNKPLDTSGLHDFLQWGDSDQVNEKEAVSKGIWRKGRYIKDSPPFHSIAYYTEYDDSIWVGVKPPIIVLRFMEVNPSKNIIGIRNAGVSNIDLNYSSLCVGSKCFDSIKNIPMSILKGSLNILKNDTLIFQLTNDSLGKSNSLALFVLPKVYTDTSLLLDYVSWGDSLQPYSGLAHIKGIWDSTTTVHLTTGKDSIVYTGDFTRLQSGSAWWQSRTPVYVPGIGITPLCNGEEVSIYPNPASKSFSIRNGYGKGQATLLDVSGRQLRNIGLNQTEQTVSVEGLGQGIYLLQLNFDSGESGMVKLVVVE